MNADDRFRRLIGTLYAAPGQDAAWTHFLQALCDAAGGAAAHFLSHQTAPHRGSISVHARVAPEALREYNLRYAAQDPWARSPHSTALKSGSVVVGDELIAHPKLKRTEYYTDFARKHDLVRCIAGVIEAAPNAVSVISINGTEARPIRDSRS